MMSDLAVLTKTLRVITANLIVFKLFKKFVALGFLRLLRTHIIGRYNPSIRIATLYISRNVDSE